MGPVADPSCRRALSRFHRFCFGALPRSPLAIAAVFALFRASLDRSPRFAARLATLRAGPRDKALLARPDIAGWLLGSFREGLKRGLAGPVWDLQLFSRAWDVDLGAIRAPARLWIGTADSAVPLSAARLLTRSIPACEVTELPAEGHFWVAANYGKVLEWVAATVRSRAEPHRSLRGATHASKVPALR
jgi:pimeloyl-ACP methyl ester carboxylesterase